MSYLALYGVYFILPLDFCGLESNCQSTVKISIISSDYKLLVTNLSHFEMLSFFAFYFIVNSGSGINFFTWVPSVNKTIGFNHNLKQ